MNMYVRFHILQVVRPRYNTGLISSILAYFSKRFELIDSSDHATHRNTIFENRFCKTDF
jgi:hypothetical protein